MTIPQEVGKVVTTSVEAMRSVPLAIALLLVNIAFLAVAAYTLGAVASNAAERNKTQTELIAKLVDQIATCSSGKTKSMLFIRGGLR